MGDYDGIKEREEGAKRMPLGMTILFIALILLGLAYIYLFLPQTTGWSQASRYDEKMKATEAARAGTAAVESMDDSGRSGAPLSAEQGKAVYDAECAMCHGEKLEGGIGLALTGPQFKYGAGLDDHVRVITEGTPDGMPGFQHLGGEKVRAVAKYIRSRKKQ